MEILTSLLFMDGWLVANPNLSRMINILAWTTNHPLWSVVIVVLSLIVIISAVNAIIRGIESIGVAVLKTPLKLVWEGIKLLFKWLGQGLIWTWKKLTKQSLTEPDNSAELVNLQALHLQKQQRLAEISTRLGEIHQEQADLLQEAANLMESQQLDLPSFMQMDNKNSTHIINN